MIRKNEFVIKEESVLSEERKKRSALLTRTRLPGKPLGKSWTPAQPLDRSWTATGHVQTPTFHQISHISGLEMTFRFNFHMILHGFSSRNQKTIFRQIEICLTDAATFGSTLRTS